MEILILLSSWNGEKYITQQLESILSQQILGNLKILVRDDGSTDGTVGIIKSFGEQVELIEGKNLGAKHSFFALIHEAQKRKADFIALADQDDIWMPRKLAAALEKLQFTQGPALYCSALSLVDCKLDGLGIYRFEERMGFQPSFFTNCVTGCTCVFNKELLACLKTTPDTAQVLMHDWWLYLVATAFGHIIYDHASYISYRQHSSNQVGMRIGFSAFFHRVNMLFKRPAKPNRLTQAMEFKRIYGSHISKENLGYLHQLARLQCSFLARVRFSPKLLSFRKGLINKLIVFAVFMAGK